MARHCIIVQSEQGLLNEYTTIIKKLTTHRGARLHSDGGYHRHRGQSFGRKLWVHRECWVRIGRRGFARDRPGTTCLSGSMERDLRKQGRQRLPGQRTGELSPEVSQKRRRRLKARHRPRMLFKCRSQTLSFVVWPSQ